MKSKPDSKPTKRRDLIIFLVALLVIAFFARDELLFFIQDQGRFLALDAEHDDFAVAVDEVRPLASTIQDQCNRAGSCPKDPVGWARQTNGLESVIGNMVYLPIRSGKSGDDEQARKFNAFKITYDYSPGWRLFANGGVGTELSLERGKHRQRKE
jgi:hypothetical protein